MMISYSKVSNFIHLNNTPEYYFSLIMHISKETTSYNVNNLWIDGQFQDQNKRRNCTRHYNI